MNENNDGRICKMSVELNRINVISGGTFPTPNKVNLLGGSPKEEETRYNYNWIIDPVTKDRVSLFSNRGKAMLKNLVRLYKNGMM